MSFSFSCASSPAQVGIAGVDHGGMTVVANNPDIIIGECAERNDMWHSHGRGRSSYGRI